MIKSFKTATLRKTMNPDALDWPSIVKPKSVKPLIGQDRALKALEFGLGNKTNGFNIYVAGYPGSGKLHAVKQFLKERVKNEPIPSDWCYVNNFEDPYHPRKIRLSPGGGKIFKQDISRFIQEARNNLIKAFESVEFSNKREAILDQLQQKEKQVFNQIQQEAKAENFVIKRTPVELIVIPLNENGKIFTEDEYDALKKNEKKKLIEKQNQIKEKLLLVLRTSRNLQKKSQEMLVKMEKEVANYAINILVDELKEKYVDQAEVLDHVETVKNDILKNLNSFIQPPEAKQQAGLNASSKAALKKYEVNVLVDNAHLKGAPFIFELNPTYNNLFGKVEHVSQMGTLITDFTLIRKGSLHAANGGYLVIPVEDLLRNYFSWDSLKRALRSNEVLIEEIGERLGYISTKSLKPDTIPLNLQIILTGTPRLYYLLYGLDADFKELFKVKADFDTSMKRNNKNVHDLLSVIVQIGRNEGLKELDHDAGIKIVEYASRLAGDQHKISTQLNMIMDIIREANYYASQEKTDQILGSHITGSIEEKYYRSNLLQEKISEMIVQGSLIIDINNAEVGQVNGISVIDLGDIKFGRPNRITASVSLGKKGVIDIEREAELGGPIHTKGVLILSGYIAEKYAQDRLINMEARLVFEQSYGGIEGDSASSAELYAIISNLADLPIKQGIAVTGSVNQKGEIQPVGAINEKIEGYFTVCKLMGLTGKQGVIIPKRNIRELMLREEVVEAVANKKFTIWGVENVDEGIEILMDVKAGKLNKNGRYYKDTIHDLVSKKIESFTHRLEALKPKTITT